MSVNKKYGKCVHNAVTSSSTWTGAYLSACACVWLYVTLQHAPTHRSLSLVYCPFEATELCNDHVCPPPPRVLVSSCKKRYPASSLSLPPSLSLHQSIARARGAVTHRLQEYAPWCRNHTQHNSATLCRWWWKAEKTWGHKDYVFFSWHCSSLRWKVVMSLCFRKM